MSQTVITLIFLAFAIIMFVTEKIPLSLTGLRHLLNPKIPTSRRNAVFFCQIFLKYMLCGVVFCVIIKYEDLV